MLYKGSCHCGKVAFEVEGELKEVADCNCSICSRKGALMWFIAGDQFRLLTPEENLKSYTFGKRHIQHQFCSECGIHPFGRGTAPNGQAMMAINARCLEDVDLSVLPVKHYDGRSL